MKRHVADNMSLRAFPDPLRAHVSDAALENDLRLTDQLVERGRDDGSGAQGAESENGDGNEEEADFHILEFDWLNVDLETIQTVIAHDPAARSGPGPGLPKDPESGLGFRRVSGLALE
jgi:hypothetical protein